MLLWALPVLAMALPVALAAFSPFLVYRDGMHILAGLSGVVALALLLPQALLIAGLLPLPGPVARRGHGWTGAAVVLAVGLHVAGLWITSPQDMADALLLRAPAWFSVWGVLACGALIATAAVALLRRRWARRWWRGLHGLLSALLVAGSVAHAMPIIGTMEPVSKAVLCLLVAAAAVAALVRRLGPALRRRG